ncbi:hypothetical protein CCP3SC15_2610004 [Gammaproteobacteria bacterium]
MEANAGVYAVYDVTHAVPIIPWWTTTGVTAAAWTRVKITFVTAPGTAQIAVFFGADLAGGALAYFDDIDLYDGTRAQADRRAGMHVQRSSHCVKPPVGED